MESEMSKYRKNITRRHIRPQHLFRKDTSEVDVPPEMIEMAHERCGCRMQELVEGYPLTSVMAKAYLQGFIDRHECQVKTEGE